VVYSYWDGSGHRKVIEVRKGVSVGRFLEMVKQQLVADFSEVRSTSPEDLIYVKEDLIIPHVSKRAYAMSYCMIRLLFV